MSASCVAEGAARGHRSADVRAATPNGVSSSSTGMVSMTAQLELGHNDAVKYVLLLCDDERMSPSMEEIAVDPAHRAYAAELERRGASVGGARLRPVAQATTVRVRDGETLISDGPFAETKDFIGGIDIIECADLDDAIAIAARHPYASLGCVEVRPVWE
ncbi:YciI family protein [Nonomuraea phyllanthi]|uniref:YciI family protein n=1 Tax=Nonomuraea phyllanthi TaxID=2219224 RepID=UPI001D1549FB|nr:YciI family protein [Nonomuraea phyllanthi]